MGVRISIAALLCFSAALAGQQTYTAADIDRGAQLYLNNCVSCHGQDGARMAGVDLRTGQFRHGASDDDLARLIGTGIPDTAMPPTNLSESSRRALVAFIRSLHDTGPGTGDAARGRELFEGKGGCLSCHRVNGKGSRTGPDLSDVGALRRAYQLERSLIVPNETVLTEHRVVRAVTRDGVTITGRRLNEDTVTLQLLDDQDRLVSLDKSALREYALLKTSSMPSYAGKLSSAELADLVTYLLSLKGVNPR